MSQFVDIIEVGKEKNVSNEKAAEMLQTFISANSGNENDTFDESKILDDVVVEQLNQVLAAIPN
ncbi:hypothetical protein JH06_3530 [Blastocystis sp. subtype 4]|uniref:hypothetical protein n=1 Tax=Blastocystis sp. subtype 4 TaxID=944170 RepID=UPI000711E801|nr:hypothetical protein JH06_3530 [Blastocystis sp. subtype 4]KNB42771.1 hypothetical protein JH06_3530 [Blastocystis sp. subtype 4]|eukprot:XP_014526214.1 hypothetical protein JH06_3530 [Blastocystis sp. subtype 4]